MNTLRDWICGLVVNVIVVAQVVSGESLFAALLLGATACWVVSSLSDWSEGNGDVDQ